jgi:hypothetical protein
VHKIIINVAFLQHLNQSFYPHSPLVCIEFDTRENFDMTSKATWKAVKAVERSFCIMLDGKMREDGSLFVTSSNLPHFSAVLADGEWEKVLSYLKMFLEENVGKVKSIKIIHDGSELISADQARTAPPPAYVLAEVANKNAGPMRTRAR